MTHFNIKPDESLFYEKLFAQCDTQKVSKVSELEAYKLFLKSGISIDDLKKICEYCGANRLGFFGRSQFYIALKMISLAQAGNDIDENMLKKNVIHSLPTFDLEFNEEAFRIVQKTSELPLTIQQSNNKYHMRTLSGNNIILHNNNIGPPNRYSYSSPISKTMIQQHASKDSLDSVPMKLDNLNTQEYNDEDEPNDEDDDDNVWDGYSEQDNRGLLGSDVKTDFNLFCQRNQDCGDESNEFSSSSEHDSSSFSYESDEDGNVENGDVQDINPTGYTLMEAVEGLATLPGTALDNDDSIPVASSEQLEYYTKCFQTIQASKDCDKVNAGEAITIFRMHDLQEECLDKILHLINITPDSQITLIEFSKALHLITHVKNGFALPETLPENLLPVEFEQPDEPFSFDLSDGELPDVSNNYQTSPVESINSVDDDRSGFDFTDVAVNRTWAQSKSRFLNKNQYSKSSNSFIQSKITDKKHSLASNNIHEETADVRRPRPCAKKSLSLSQPISSSVAPPPPPRSSVPSEILNKKFSSERNTDPSGDSYSVVSCATFPRESDVQLRKFSETSKSEITNNARFSINQEPRKQLQISMRDLKSKNHVLLRLNNEMTSELDELREQRVNLHLQLEYIKQSQIDIQ